MNNREKLKELISDIYKIDHKISERLRIGDIEAVNSLNFNKNSKVRELIHTLNMELNSDRMVKSNDDTNSSVKNDRLDDKLRWELLPLEDVEDIVRVYTAGAKKYGENKWQDLPDGIRRYKAALLRHLVEYDKGNEIDEETGCFHLAQVAWNAIAMLHISKQKQQ